MSGRIHSLLMIAMASALPAQQLIQFEDGSRVEGRVTRVEGASMIVTVFGARPVVAGTLDGQVPADDVSRLRALYAEQAEDVVPGFTAGRVALARWCMEQGLLSGAKEQIEAVVRVDPDSRSANALIGEIAAAWRLDTAEGGAKPRDRRRFVKDLFSRHAAKDLTTAMIAWHKAQALDPAETLRPALKGLKHKSAGVRWLSARILARHRNHPERINPLYKRALVDPAAVVRRAAVRSLKVTNDPVFARLFAKNLGNPKQRLRMTAAEALAELGLEQGVEPLVGALKALASGGGGVRAHIAVTTQKAYVKDFDVEIAQAAVIADPIVDIVTEGVVLDVTVVGISVERGAYTRALRRLTGEGFGADVKAWEGWLRRRQK